MRYADLTESLTIKDILTATYRHYREHVQNGEYENKNEFLDAYREVKAELVFPRRVYRGLSGKDVNWDAFYDSPERLDADDEYDQAKLAKVTEFASSINWSAIGTCWTWDKECAVIGGALGREADTNVIIEAEVKYADIDIATTLWQNLTVYQEEKEIRLKPNRPIKIIGITPALVQGFPIRANTGTSFGDEASPESIMKYLTRQ